MSNAFRLAMTGSPGTGKSTISDLLSGFDYDVETMESLATRLGCIGDVDPEDGARPIDMDELQILLEDEWEVLPSVPTVIDGHLSHLLPVDCAVILRCRPSILKERLAGRSYSRQKTSENVDWEILGGSWAEIDESVPAIEFDTSSEGVGEIVQAILGWIADDFKPRRPLNPIDWVDQEEA